ncbi:hypothetical protein BDF19DRAFT_426499 [Syncephalis fuscata]|nr:hypothetical protein BDF19DRAFT_426499 [Syncephalis fuscata]
MMTDTNYVPPSANVDDISLARASTVLSASGTTTNLLLKRKNTNDTADICLYLDEDIENVDELADAMDMASNMASVADGTQPAGSAIVHRKRARGERVPWLPEEDNLLRLAVQLYGYNTDKWTKISACVPGRGFLLREAHAHFGEQWSRVAELVPGRTDDQCSKRWRESLDPAIDRSEWTDAEDQDLLRLVGEFGSQWQRIAEYFPGRPGLHCRNRWRKLCRSINPFKHLRNGRGMPDAAAIIAGLDIDSLTSDNNNNASAILDATAHHNDNVQDSFIEDRQWMSMFDGDDDQREYERGDGKDDDEDTDEDIRAELARQMAVRSSPTGNIVPNNNASTTDAIHMTTNTHTLKR